MTQDEIDLIKLEDATDAMAAAVLGVREIAVQGKTPAVRQAAYLYCALHLRKMKKLIALLEPNASKGC